MLMFRRLNGCGIVRHVAKGSSIASGPAPADCSFVLLMARAFYGTTIYVLRSWASAGLYNEYHQSLRRRTRPSGPGLTNLLCHRDYGPADPRGIFLPAHDWDGSPGKVMRHSIRRAAILRGSGPEQRLGALEDSEADGSWRTKRSDGM